MIEGLAAVVGIHRQAVVGHAADLFGAGLGAAQGEGLVDLLHLLLGHLLLRVVVAEGVRPRNIPLLDGLQYAFQKITQDLLVDIAELIAAEKHEIGLGVVHQRLDPGGQLGVEIRLPVEVGDH